MTETRTGYLLAALRAEPEPVTTHRAEEILAASPYSAHRNSARRSLRTLTRLGHLAAHDHDGRRTYTPTGASA